MRPLINRHKYNDHDRAENLLEGRDVVRAGAKNSLPRAC